MKLTARLKSVNNLSTSEQLVLLVTAGVVCRLLLLLLIDVTANIGKGDDAYYLALAESLKSGQYSRDGIPDFERAPGYPFFLAMAWTKEAAIVLQSVVSIGATVLVMLTLRSFWPAISIVTCPFLIGPDFIFGSETLFISLLLMAFMILFHRGLWRAGIGGVLLGLAILTRETLLLLPIVLVVAGFALNRRRDLLIAAVAAYLVVAPWAVRNSLIPGGSFALSQNHPGYVLWVGTWERNGDWMRDGIKKIENYPAYAFRTQQEKERLSAALPLWIDVHFKEVAIDRITSNPIEVVGTWVARYPQLWISTRTEQWYLRIEGLPWVVFKVIMLTLNALILAAGLFGAWLAWRRRASYVLFIVPVVYHALLYVPFHNTEARYSLPAIPFLLILAFYGLMTRTSVSQKAG